MLRVLRAKGYSDLDVDALRGGAEEAAALEALGARFPEIDPAAAEHVRGDDARGRVQAERDPVLGGGDDRRADRSGRGAEAVRRGCGALVADLDVSVEILFGGEAERVADGPLYGAMEAAVLSCTPTRSSCRTCPPASPIRASSGRSAIPTYGLMPVLLPRAEHGKIHGGGRADPGGRIGR